MYALESCTWNQIVKFVDSLNGMPRFSTQLTILICRALDHVAVICYMSIAGAPSKAIICILNVTFGATSVSSRTILLNSNKRTCVEFDVAGSFDIQEVMKASLISLSLFNSTDLCKNRVFFMLKCLIC